MVRKMKVNLEKEIKILENNYANQVKNTLYKKYSGSKNTFRESNWLITFPFNFLFTEKKVEIAVVRKIATINAIYGFFFLREDAVLDEYHKSQPEYKNILISMCDAQNFRNLAIGQLLYLCGTDIYDYIFKYEKVYYDALIFEKVNDDINFKNMFDYKNLLHLGHKLMPLCTSFVAFCFFERRTENIQICEKMLINYHIAYQLYDDILDIKKDLMEPDLSYTLRAIKNSQKLEEIILSDVELIFRSTGIVKKISRNIEHYLGLSKKYAEQLNFTLFLSQIKRVEQSLQILKKKYNMCI